MLGELSWPASDEAGLLAAGELDAGAEVGTEQGSDLGEVVAQRAFQVAFGDGGEFLDLAGGVGLDCVRLDLELVEAEAVGGGVVVGGALEGDAGFLPDGLVTGGGGRRGLLG